MKQIGVLLAILSIGLSAWAQAPDTRPQTSKITPAQRLSEALSRVRGSRQKSTQSPPARVKGAQNQLFLVAPQYPVGNGPVWVVTADFNRDGKLDIATVNLGFTASTVSVLLGNGDGTFQPRVDYTVGYAATLAAVGDFNGDGKPDLVVANTCATQDCSFSSMSILLGTGRASHPQPCRPHPMPPPPSFSTMR